MYRWGGTAAPASAAGSAVTSTALPEDYRNESDEGPVEGNGPIVNGHITASDDPTIGPRGGYLAKLRNCAKAVT